MSNSPAVGSAMAAVRRLSVMRKLSQSNSHSTSRSGRHVAHVNSAKNGIGNISDSIATFFDDSTKSHLNRNDVFELYSYLRLNGLSFAQIDAAMDYVCLNPDCCEVTELIDLLRELDRRYFMLSNLRWEFSLLDVDGRDALPLHSAKLFLQMVHKDHFSEQRWTRFLSARSFPQNPFTFQELEVELCRIPERDVELSTSMSTFEDLEQFSLPLFIETPINDEPSPEATLPPIEVQEQKVSEPVAIVEIPVNDKERGSSLLSEEEAVLKQRLQELEEKEREREKREADEARQAEVIAKQAADKERQTGDVTWKHERIRYDLKVAIKQRSLSKLVAVVKEFKKEALIDTDGDLATAETLIKILKAKNKLLDAIEKRDLKLLEAAMDYVQSNNFESDLIKEMAQAHLLLLRLRRMERIRAEILALKQSTVAEIRSYSKPPPQVHQVMTATFVLLGHKEMECEVWKTVQALVGKTGPMGLKRRCLSLDPTTVNPEHVTRCKQLIQAYELDEIRDVSAGAATFYCWSSSIIEEVEAREQEKTIK